MLECRRCGAEIPADNVDLGTALAKCRFCNAVFGFADQLSGHKAAPSPMDIPLPRGIEVSEHGDELRLVRRWFTPALFFMLLFCVVWNGFLVFWYSVTIEGGAPLIFSLFPLIHVAVGVGLTYATVAGFVNRTHITADPGRLRIRHQPLPWPGNRELPVSELEQLYCEEHVSRTRNGTSVSYTLNAVLQGGRKLTLLKRLQDPGQAIYLEHAIEKHLGIANRPVPGELRR